MIRALFEIGRERTQHWLTHTFAALGQRATIDIRRDYLDDTGIHATMARPVATRPKRFQPWLARLFKRSRLL